MKGRGVLAAVTVVSMSMSAAGAFAGCVGDSGGPTDAGPATGQLGGPCFPNGTCSSPFACLGGAICVQPADSGPDGNVADSGPDAPAKHFCTDVDATWCEDFDQVVDVTTLGTVATYGDAGPPTLSQDAALSAPNSLSVVSPGAGPEFSYITHPIAKARTGNVTIEFDMKCSHGPLNVGVTSGVGLSLSNGAYIQPFINSGIAGLYYVRVEADGGLTGMVGSNVPLTCDASFRHFTLRVTATQATLSVGGNTTTPIDTTSLPTGAFFARLGIVASYANSPFAVNIDNAVVQVE